jgi:hypothetical protein
MRTETLYKNLAFHQRIDSSIMVSNIEKSNCVMIHHLFLREP